MPVSRWSKILFDGFKLNHPRNVALIYPIIFLVRRLILALTLVFLQEWRHWGLFITMTTTWMTLTYIIIEHPWLDEELYMQHVANEICLYILCVTSLFFCYLDSTLETRSTVAHWYLGVFLVFTYGNLMLTFAQAFKHLRLVLKRRWKRRLRARLAK